MTIKPIKIVVAGLAMLLVAGPVDFAWHSAFGFDGLLSPPHLVLVSGMIASSVGALAGMVFHGSMAFREPRLPPLLIIIGILPVWLAASGAIDMFSLPFSHTGYFNFDPHPVIGVTVASLAFPALVSLLACVANALSGRRFGIMTAVAGSFMITSMLTAIVPNDSLVQTLPFYLANIIPFIAADALLSFSRSRVSLYLAGAIVALGFFTLYYPLITYTYSKVLDTQTVWPSLIASTYFGMIVRVLPLVIAPAAAMGIVGAAVSARLIVPKKKDL